MNCHYVPSDIMSSLPPNVLGKILTLMPMQDAFRTSILSQDWRYCCVNIPKLVFDDTLFEGSSNRQLSIKCKLLHVIYPVLLLHDGPILEFSLSFSELHSCCEIDQIIFHLLRNNTVEKFTLCISLGNVYKLPSSFFSWQLLTHLKLQNCAFQPPSTFCGFSRLTSLYFDNVNIAAKMLLLSISNCQILKSFTLIEDEKHFTDGNKSGFVELFECLPLIEHLHMSCYPIKVIHIHFNITTSLLDQYISYNFKKPMIVVNPLFWLLVQVLCYRLYTAKAPDLRVLNLSGLCFAKEDELSATLFLICSSPNIEKIKMQMSNDTNVAVPEAVKDFFELRDFSDVSLAHLNKLEIINLTEIKPGLEFLKLILAKSPVLKQVQIVIDSRKVGVNEEVKMLRELLRFPHASNRAEIHVDRYPESNVHQYYPFTNLMDT